MTTALGGDESGRPSDPRSPLTRPWQTGRDDDADHNGTFSRPLTDLKGSSGPVRLLWQSGGSGGTMTRQSWPRPITAPLCITELAGGRGKYGSKIEIRYHKPDLWLSQVRLIHVILRNSKPY